MDVADILSELRRWLDPPKFAVEFERALNMREEGTGQWLFEHRDFLRWDQIGGPKMSVGSCESELKLHERCLWVVGELLSQQICIRVSSLRKPMRQSWIWQDSSCSFHSRTIADIVPGSLHWLFLLPASNTRGIQSHSGVQKYLSSDAKEERG
jgi:hypothetical protein